MFIKNDESITLLKEEFTMNNQPLTLGGDNRRKNKKTTQSYPTDS